MIFRGKKTWLGALAVAAVIVLGVFLLPNTVQTAEAATSGTCGANLTWTLDNAGALTISGTGAMTNWSSTTNVPWYSNRSSIQHVIIKAGVTSIGGNAFRGCTGLTGITIPDGVTSIGNYAFCYCSSLTSVTIPDSVTSIGDDAFSGCTGLTSVYITDLGAWCGISFYCENANPLYYAKNLYLNGELLTDAVIPDGVTSIGSYAFNGCTGLTSITIPDGVTSIGHYAFYNCSGLTSITIPDSVTSIGGYAFYNCSGLTSITIPDSVTSIGGSAFSSCTGLTSITIPDSVTSIGDGAFCNCTGLTSITIPDGVTSIRGYAFENCTGLTSITIPDGVTYIGYYAFSGCTGLTSITIPDSVTSIGHDAFYGCEKLPDVTFTGGSVTQTLVRLLPYTQLTDITVADGVTDIGTGAFRDCGGLLHVTCGKDVKTINNSAFAACDFLETIRFTGHAPTFKGNCFTDVCATIYYPAGDPTWTEAVRQSYGGDLTWEAYGEATQSVPELAFTAASLTLENNLKVNLLVEKALLDDAGYLAPYVVFTLDGVQTVAASYTEKDGYYAFSLADITPAQMNDTITATLYATYGDALCHSAELTYRVTQYCYNMLSDSNSSAKLRTLLVDLLRYGAAAQRYTGHNTAALADAMLTEEQAAWGTQSDPALTSVTNPSYAAISQPEVTWEAAGLRLGNGVTMQLYFTAESVEGLTIRIADENGKALDTLGQGNFVMAAGYYLASYRGINAGQLSDTVYITAYRGGVPVSNTLAYSVESYAYAKQNDGNAELAALVKALMNYGNAARAYAQ